MATERRWTITVDQGGRFICHGDFIAARLRAGRDASEPGWRVIEVVPVSPVVPVSVLRDEATVERVTLTIMRWRGCSYGCGHSTEDDPCGCEKFAHEVLAAVLIEQGAPGHTETRRAP